MELVQAKYPPRPLMVRMSIPLKAFLHLEIRCFPMPSKCNHAALHTGCPGRGLKIDVTFGENPQLTEGS